MEHPPKIVNKTEGDHSSFEQAINLGIQHALKRVKERFEQAENPLDRLDYHNSAHTTAVIERTKKILRTVEEAVPGSLSERLIGLGEYIAANHDTVQEYEIVTRESDGAQIRRRFAQRNETASADEALEDIHKINPDLLTAEEKDLVRRAIDVTVPDYDPKLGTVIQPNLTPESSLVIRALALADLGAAGMDEYEAFAEEGNANFREENIDIAQAVAEPQNVSEEQKTAFTKRMLAWSETQRRFAEGRKAMLDTELAGLPEEAQRAVAGLFTHFNENIQHAQARTEVRNTLPFEELIRDFGYPVSTH